jgi:hypothetical protein
LGRSTSEYQISRTFQGDKDILGMEILYQGKIEKNELVSAGSMHVKPSRLAAILRIILLIIFCGSALWLLIEDFSYWQIILIGWILPIAILSRPWWTPYTFAGSANREGNIYHGPINGIVNDTGISLVGAKSSHHYNWSAFIAFKETEDIVLLYQSKNCFNLFSKRLFSTDNEWQQFRSLSRQRVAEQKKSA